ATVVPTPAAVSTAHRLATAGAGLLGIHADRLVDRLLLGHERATVRIGRAHFRGQVVKLLLLGGLLFDRRHDRGAFFRRDLHAGTASAVALLRILLLERDFAAG